MIKDNRLRKWVRIAAAILFVGGTLLLMSRAVVQPWIKSPQWVSLLGVACVLLSAGLKYLGRADADASRPTDPFWPRRRPATFGVLLGVSLFVVAFALASLIPEEWFAMVTFSVFSAGALTALLITFRLRRATSDTGQPAPLGSAEGE